MKKLINVFMIVCLMAFCLVGCKGTAEEAEEENDSQTVESDVIAKSPVITDEESGNTEEKSEEENESEEESEDTENSEESEPAETEEEPTADITSEENTSTKYKFQTFVLESAADGNAAFSGEAFLTQVGMYSEFLTASSKEPFTKILGREYQTFSFTDSLTPVQEIWLNENMEVAEDFTMINFIQNADMSSPNATFQKNQLVSTESGGVYNYTPSGLFEDTQADFICLMYPDSQFDGGNRPYDTEARIFYNKDGSEQRTVMMHDQGTSYYALDNAKAYKMKLGGGLTLTFVLPDKDISLSDVNLSDLLEDKLTPRTADVEFYAPEFSCKSAYQLTLSDIGLGAGKIDTEKVSNLSDYDPVFYQMTDFSFSRFGVGKAQEVEEQVSFPKKNDEDDTINIICSRPFMYYVYDESNEEVAVFGVVNKITDNMAVSEKDAGIEVPEE